MMACTIKEFIICPRIITFHVIQKSSVQTGIYKSWALSRATDSLSMWPVHLQRELAEHARRLRVCSPAPSLKRVMNHRKNQKKEIRSWTGWVWRKQDFCWRPQTGQERMSRGCTGVEHNENSPEKISAVDSHTSPKTAGEVYSRKNTRTAQLPRLSAVGYT